LTTTTTCYRPNSSSSSSRTHKPRPKAVFLNATRLDYDGQLDWSRLQQICDLTLHPADAVTDSRTLLDLVQDAEIVLTKEMALPAAVFSQFPPSVRLLCEAGTGFNNLPVAAARARGIPVCNIPTYSTEAVAHMAITYLMNFSVSMLDQQRMLQAGDRSNFTGPFRLPLHEIHDKTIVLVGGAGRIGTKVAEIALALGMHVTITSRRGSLPADHRLYGHARVTCTDQVASVLGKADYVSLHTPLNDATRGGFGRAQISLMRKTAFLINTSRGAVCNEDELIACLEEGLIRGAGLDVTTTEPPAADSKLWDLQNVWLSPHTGWRRVETRQRLVDMTCDNIASYCEAQTEADILNKVN
jgi:glycerate dehydrogenase